MSYRRKRIQIRLRCMTISIMDITIMILIRRSKDSSKMPLKVIALKKSLISVNLEQVSNLIKYFLKQKRLKNYKIKIIQANSNLNRVFKRAFSGKIPSAIQENLNIRDLYQLKCIQFWAIKEKQEDSIHKEIQWLEKNWPRVQMNSWLDKLSKWIPTSFSWLE